MTGLKPHPFCQLRTLSKCPNWILYDNYTNVKHTDIRLMKSKTKVIKKTKNTLNLPKKNLLINLNHYPCILFQYFRESGHKFPTHIHFHVDISKATSIFNELTIKRKEELLSMKTISFSLTNPWETYR